MSVMPTIEPLTVAGPTVMRVTWRLTDADPEGGHLLVLQWIDRSVQVEGEFGGGHVVLEVSNSGEDYVDGPSVAFPDVIEAPLGAYLRPVLNRPTPESRVRVTLTGRRP